MTEDGNALPLSYWQTNSIDAVLIAVHGFNDYRNFFAKPAEFFTSQNIACYAYDQRGFGGSPQRGYWSGADSYAEDLAVFARLIRARHPNVPIYLLGESMGASVIVRALALHLTTGVNGVILSAPAVWGRSNMPWYQTSLLWLLTHSVPWMTLTGRGLDITPSDNIEMLRELSRDPMTIKRTRVDAVSGVTNLMDKALQDAKSLSNNILLLYGEKDEIIPWPPTFHFIRDMFEQSPENKTVALYSNGYHMLLRDLQAPLVWQDISSWMESPRGPLPSGADDYAAKIIEQRGVPLPETRAEAEIDYFDINRK